MVEANEWFDVKILILDDIHIVMINDILKLITRFDGFKHCRFHDKPLEEFRQEQLNNEDIMRNVKYVKSIGGHRYSNGLDRGDYKCKSLSIEKCNEKECVCIDTIIKQSGLDQYYDIDRFVKDNNIEILSKLESTSTYDQI